MKSSLRSLLLFTMVSWLLPAGTTRTASLADDNASNYNGTWTSGDNNGTGFNPWSLKSDNSQGGFAGFFIGDSRSLSGGSGANINAGDNASFGLYANQNSNVFANADRSFAGGALAAGQTFSLDLAVNFRNGAKGINLRNDAGTVIFTFNVTADSYTVSDGKTTSGSFGDYSDNTAFHLNFSQTSDAGGSWTVLRSGGVTSTVTGTYSGDASSFRLFIGNTDAGDENNLFANNFAVTGVPEPATWLGGALVLAAVGWRWQRSRSRPVHAAA